MPNDLSNMRCQIIVNEQKNLRCQNVGRWCAVRGLVQVDIVLCDEHIKLTSGKLGLSVTLLPIGVIDPRNVTKDQ